ncbi:hypothetical protein WJX72_000313 [[Myrmecia] bisecta]|uniref:non-specific serine/threonine protein kinase n=1 Tax=[Myrmecia] bisecta TaxID=41462 RepID=A0AAW1QDZ7_9CHLO
MLQQTGDPSVYLTPLPAGGQGTVASAKAPRPFCRTRLALGQCVRTGATMHANDSLVSLNSLPSIGSDYVSSHDPHADDEDDEIAEHDPTGRYCRYKQEVGKGRFKQVYKGFDEKQGIDIAWSKIQRDRNHLDEQQMHRIVEEMSIGLELDHPNIIKCYKCWEDRLANCINLVTEYFTSGNLRDYRQRHKHLELKAVKKWARQILSGLDSLHLKDPPIAHGDLRCDKIYINGHSGEIKIGDLGLATLLPCRFAPGVLPDGVNKENQYTRQVDIFAFGLCTLELATLKKLDSSNCAIWPQLLETVQDEAARSFIHRCLGPAESRPSARELLEDPFFARRPTRSDSHKKAASSEPELERGAPDQSARASRTSVDSDADAGGVSCTVGTVRGEDYNFQFSGKIKDGKLHFRLNMEYEGSDTESAEVGSRRTIDFTYDPEVDTPDEIATEISNEFNLSSTDRDICAAALKEWLAKEMPG